MNVKKYIRIGALFLLFIIPVLFTILYPQKILFNIPAMIENEDINDISLTIYYMDLQALLFYPVSSVEDLIQWTDDEKIVISGSKLEEHVDLFRKMSNEGFTQVWKKSSDLDLRIYYVLESKKNGKLFDVAMWGDNGSIFVNGIEVKENKVFYDVIIPFLPEDVARDLEAFFI